MSNIISVTFKGLTCDNLKNILKERERREWVIVEKNWDTLDYTYIHIGVILNKPFILYISYQFNFRSFRLRNFHLPILGIQSRSINIFIDFYSTLCFYWLLCYFDYLAPCTLNFKFIPLSPFKPPWHLTFVFQMHVYAIMYLVVAAIRVCLYVCGFYWISTQTEIFTK